MNYSRKLIISMLALALVAGFIYSKPKKAQPAKQNSQQSKQPAADPFTNYPEDFAEIMRASLRSAEAGNFSLAADDFVSRGAFEYHRKDYASKPSNEQNLAKIDSSIDSIKKQINSYKSLQVEINSAKESVSDKTIQNLIKIRNKIREDGAAIQTAGSSGYPSYLSKFMLGVKEDPKSGLLGIIDMQIDQILEFNETPHLNSFKAEVKNLSTSLEAKSLFTSESNSAKAQESASKLSASAKEIQKIRSYYDQMNFKSNKPKETEVSNKRKSINSLVAILDESGAIFDAISGTIAEKKAVRTKPLDVVEATRSNTDNYSQKLVDSAKNLMSYSRTASTAKKSDAIKILSSFSDENLSFKTFTDIYMNTCTAIDSTCVADAVALWIETANYYSSTGSILYDNDLETLEKLNVLLTPDDAGTTYPAKSLKILEELKANISKDNATLLDFKTKLSEGYIYRANFMSQQESLSESTKKISSIDKNFDAIQQKARQMILEAEIAKNEVNIYYSRSLDNFNKNNFNLSFENWQKANSTYANLSEQFKKDGDTQAEVFERLTKLRHDIIEKEKPVFVSKIRTLKNSARTSYYAGNFNEASAYLAEADNKRNIWEKLMDVAMEEDAELERLKDFVNTAIAIKEGREISPYDSKAPEMKQNLSIANLYFAEGTKLYNSGDTEKGKELLSKSKEKINQIKIYYPRNKDSSILSLQIDKLLDPTNFSAVFDAKVKAAKETNFTTRSLLAQESYSTLLDLYELNPNYPGLKKLIDNAEIDLGLRQRPIDTTKIENAKKLAQEAQQLLNSAGRDTILLMQARKKAQDAIDLNPANSQAITILDEIAFRTGGQSAVTLSAKDEQLYQDALSDLQKNNVISANAKITKLLANESNARSAKVLKLKKRIEAQL